MNESFVPFERMLERVKRDKEDSDVAAFYSLLFAGEFLTKLVTAGLLAGVDDDKDRNRYGVVHKLVRSDGIGEWGTGLDAILTGPTSQHLRPSFRGLQRELSERVGKGAWQHDAVLAMHEALDVVGITHERLGDHAQARAWFALFPILRNKTRGHGASTVDQCRPVAQALETGIKAIFDNFGLFRLPWAYLHRNLSGKYRVSPISGSQVEFNALRADNHHRLSDGVHLWLEDARRVELVFADVELTDFFVPNGQFRGDSFETLSYITNDRHRVAGQDYLVPASQLPASETEGSPALDVHGEALANLPPRTEGYVRRSDLETRLRVSLENDRHEIVTLSGPGGAGKTSLALAVIHDMVEARERPFDLVVWFSARDIDLLPSGPKPVRPKGLHLEDFASEFVRLVGSAKSEGKQPKPSAVLAEQLTKSQLGKTLFIFDNFETVVEPLELYRWLDTYVRAPNKILITTRMREFDGDRAIEVFSMTTDEASLLIAQTAAKLGIAQLITDRYRDDLIAEASGHPYVLKILLGEVAKAGRPVKPERLVASQEDILQALFERTYNALTPAAQRVFLLLSNWRSVVPALAVEAVVLRSAEDRIDVNAAIGELRRLSLIEEIPGSSDATLLLAVPLAAATFARRKLNASPLKIVIESDTKLLQSLGASRVGDLQQGIEPRLRRLLDTLADRIARREETFQSIQPLVEFFGSRLPSLWPPIAELALFTAEGDAHSLAKQYLRRFLEVAPHGEERNVAWRRLGEICRRDGDFEGELHAMAELVDSPKLGLDDLSRTALRVNALLNLAKNAGKTVFGADERRALLERIIRRVAAKANEMDATDLSRLAWLYVYVKDYAKARAVVTEGIAMEPNNPHLLSLTGQPFYRQQG